VKKVLGWVLWFPLSLALVWFLVANRQPVAISLDPFSLDSPAIASLPLPLWVWLTASLLAGFFLGAIGMWLSARPSRRRASADREELKALKRAAAERPSAGQPETLPAIEPL
jgi:hypothetical protein